MNRLAGSCGRPDRSRSLCPRPIVRRSKRDYRTRLTATDQSRVYDSTYAYKRKRSRSSRLCRGARASRRSRVHVCGVAIASERGTTCAGCRHGPERRVLGASCCLLLLAGAPAAAQVDTGTILGTVKDQSGGVLPGATVTITHEGQGFTLSTVTREDGTYIFTPIRTGAYTVEVEFPGFSKTERRGISVSIQQTGAWSTSRSARQPDRGGRRHGGVAAARRPAPARSARRSAPRPSRTCRSTAATTPSSPA